MDKELCHWWLALIGGTILCSLINLELGAVWFVAFSIGSATQRYLLSKRNR